MTLPRLKTLRERAALTQRGLAERSGISYVTIARIEAGREAYPTTAAKLAKSLGVEPAELMAPSRDEGDRAPSEVP